MKAQTLKALIVISFLTASTPALAGFWSSTKLVQILEEDMHGAATYEIGMASGYVLGVFDVADGVFACAPDGVSAKQVKQVVFNYMKAHPEQWSNSADASVVAALRLAWPCTKK